jgi:uncharacterized protein (DUF305 family)
MNKNPVLAAGLVFALALPSTGLAQMGGHGAQADQDAPQGGMMQGGMMPEGMVEHMRDMMRPMMQEMMREMMMEMQTGEAAPESTPSDAEPADHEAHHPADDEQAAGSAATEAYRAANTAMHEAMNIEFSDNADIDFARGMIGHHEGAIDMARIVLEHGEDPDLRQLAEEIIEAQEAEITFLQEWIAENAE